MKLSLFWRRITATGYTRTLEAEVARLRAENRALLNSILGIAGVPPIPVGAGELKDDAGGAAPAKEGTRRGPQALHRSLAPDATGDAATQAAETGANVIRSANAARPRKPNSAQVTPVRRRSWHQITRTLEFEAAKKKPQDMNSKQ